MMSVGNDADDAARTSAETGAAQADAGGTAGGAQQVDAETLAKIAAVRSRLHETFGKIVLALMTVPRYRNQSLNDLGHLVLDPILRDRIAIASSGKDGEPIAGTLAGIAIWASVSEDVDAKIREQIKAGTFPVRLQPDDWTSGTINWLLDIIAPSPRLTTEVIANFRQVVPDGDMRIHPILKRLIEPEALEKMSARPIRS